MSSTTQKLKTERVNDLYSKEWKKKKTILKHSLKEILFVRE